MAKVARTRGDLRENLINSTELTQSFLAMFSGRACVRVLVCSDRAKAGLLDQGPRPGARWRGAQTMAAALVCLAGRRRGDLL